MFRADETLTPELFAFSPRDLVSKDSDAWLYVDLFDELELKGFSGDYSAQGEEAVHPALMLRTIFYGLTHGVCTGRKLEEACRFDNRFIVLSGNQKPSYRTFYRFLIRHEGRLNALFVQVVKLAQKMGLVSLGRVAIDGSRFKANTSRHKAMSYGRMKQAVEELQAELKKLREDLAKENGKERTSYELPQEIQLKEKRLAKITAAKAALESEAQEQGTAQAIEDKQQKSFADPDALPLAKPKDGFMYGYNCQAAVDSEHQIVVAAELHDNAADTAALEPMVKQVQVNCGSIPEALLADAGYRSTENLERMETLEVEAYIAVGQGEFNPERDHLEALRWDEPDGTYECPEGKPIALQSRQQDGSQRLRMDVAHCEGCARRGDCPLSSRQGKIFRVPREADRQRIAAHQVKMRSEKGREIYRRRKVIVEPVFGNIKNKGWRITCRGRHRVGSWWKLVCTAHNLEKIIPLRAVRAAASQASPAEDRALHDTWGWLTKIRALGQIALRAIWPRAQFNPLCVTSS